MKLLRPRSDDLFITIRRYSIKRDLGRWHTPPCGRKVEVSLMSSGEELGKSARVPFLKVPLVNNRGGL